MPETKKPDLSTQIADDVIAKALESVERHGKANEIAIEPESAPEEPADEAAAEPQEPDASQELARLNKEIEKLRADLLEARQTLRQREAELEASQTMGRQTLEKLKDQHERMLRAAADLENHKKRVIREREETAKFGQERLLREVLPIVDNLDRALEHAVSPNDFAGLKTGIQMTRKLCDDILGRFGVKGFSALGQAFDPNLHEAMQAMESDQPAGSVVQELVRGYRLHERLMRPAMVVVAKPRSAPPAKAQAATAQAPASEPAAAKAPAAQAGAAKVPAAQANGATESPSEPPASKPSGSSTDGTKGSA